MYKCVIFDLDGTLLNTLKDLSDAGNYALRELGYPVWDTERYKYFVGNGIPKLIQRILPADVNEDIRKKALEIFCSYYNEHMNDNTVPYDGIIEMLKKLKEKKLTLLVVTNKADEFAGDIVKRYFGNLIDETYGSIEGFPKKPDSYWVDKAVSDYGFLKDDVFYIGDSGVDMQTAVNAGVTACGVLWGFRSREELEENGAEFICENCIELLDLILSQ